MCIRDSPKLVCCKALKTDALQQVIKEYEFDGLIVGVRRDEEGSRSKERVFSERNANDEWDYTNQPPELWDQFKTDFPKGNHIRVHPQMCIRDRVRVKTNSVIPSLLVTVMFSLWLLRMVLTMYSPSPTPSLSMLRERSDLWNRSKIMLSSSGGMVSPWFLTEM